MKKALAIGLAAAMAVTMTAPVYASDDSESGKGIAKEDLKIGAITSAMRTKVTQQLIWLVSMKCRRHLALTIHRLSKKL